MMPDSTKRAIRTLIQAILALPGVVATLVVISSQTGLDKRAWVTTALTAMTVWTGVMAKVVNLVEERFPSLAVLKTSSTTVLSAEPGNGLSSDEAMAAQEAAGATADGSEAALAAPGGDLNPSVAPGSPEALAGPPATEDPVAETPVAPAAAPATGEAG